MRGTSPTDGDEATSASDPTLAGALATKPRAQAHEAGTRRAAIGDLAGDRPARRSGRESGGTAIHRVLAHAASTASPRAGRLHHKCAGPQTWTTADQLREAAQIHCEPAGNRLGFGDLPNLGQRLTIKQVIGRTLFVSLRHGRRGPYRTHLSIEDQLVPDHLDDSLMSPTWR